MSKIHLGISIVNLAGLVLVIFLQYRYQQEVVYVDSMKLVNGYQGMIDARKVYQQKASKWKSNIDTLASEVQRQIMEYEKASSRMSAKEKQLSEELIRTKQKQLYDYQQAMNTQAQQEDSKMTGEVLTQINAYIKKFGEKNGYKIILAATEYGNLAYAHETLDITDVILEGLNKEYSGK